MSSVRTRFAPSPTGALHVGGVRTALFNYLHARHTGGRFILRIEDTDRQRSSSESTQEILGAMTWLGLEWDEGPFFQTDRAALYAATIERLLSSGSAYPCTCAPGDLEARRKAAISAGKKPSYDRTCRPGFGPGPTPGQANAIRFAVPNDREIPIRDLVKGPVAFHSSDVEDFVIARSDGTPTYNLCVTADDADMGITDVIRGDDHLANTPKQILIYQALGAPLPRFAHLPQVLGMDRARLSKRHAATAVVSYRELGYFPDALINFLARLGWSHGDQEIFSRAQLIEAFTLESVGKSAGVFNLEKLDWLNFQYLKARPDEQLAADLRPFIAAEGLSVPGDDAWLARMVGPLKERARTLLELVQSARYFLSDELVWDDKAVRKFLTPESRPLIAAVADRLETLAEFRAPAIEVAFHEIAEREGKSLGNLAQPIRVALTGGSVSPGIFDVLEILGRERSLARLRAAVARSGAAPPAT